MAKLVLTRRDLAALALGGLLPSLPARALASTTYCALTLNSLGRDYFANHYWCPEHASNSYAILEASCTSGLPKHRFEVRSGDTWNNQPGVGRAEFQCIDRVSWNKAIWFSYEFYVHSGSRPATRWNVLGQFHHTPDSSDGGGISPPFAIELRPNATYGELLYFLRRYNANAVGTAANTTSVVMNKRRFTRNCWHRIVGCIVFDWKGAGSVDLWYDGTKIIAQHGVPIGFNDVTGPYFKFGIYRADVSDTLVTEYANLEHGYSSLLTRVTSPLAI